MLERRAAAAARAVAVVEADAPVPRRWKLVRAGTVRDQRGEEWPAGSGERDGDGRSKDGRSRGGVETEGVWKVVGVVEGPGGGMAGTARGCCSEVGYCQS